MKKGKFSKKLNFSQFYKKCKVKIFNFNFISKQKKKNCDWITKPDAELVIKSMVSPRDWYEFIWEAIQSVVVVVLSAILPQFLQWISQRQAYQPVRLENDHTQAGLAVQTPATQTKNKIWFAISFSKKWYTFAYQIILLAELFKFKISLKHGPIIKVLRYI